MTRSFGKRATGLRLERMRASKLWRDGGFRNIHPQLPGLRRGEERPGIGDFLWGGQWRTPGAPLPMEDPREPWTKKPQSGLRLTWLGHSTVYIEIDGVRLITDPVFGHRASPFALVGPLRFHRPPVALRQTPEVDAVLISHDHYDHLDYPTILQLARGKSPFITALGVGAHLEAWGVPPERIIELDWWESATVAGSDIQVTATPAQHFSGRGPGLSNSTLWSSFAVRGPKNSVFFSGDTGLSTQYTQIKERLGVFDVAMLEVGAYHPSWGNIHLGPENALRAFGLLGARRFMPVHWSTFNLAMHSWDDPAETVFQQAPALGVELFLPLLGQAQEPLRAEAPQAWWRSVVAAERRQGDGRSRPPVTEGEQQRAIQTVPQWPLD
ncbi:MAG: MBL fold metallo-hydrolase [Leptospirales bacterium]|nr:MBL fold metallo-hydrolase [Leptospirales bacterium]